MNPMDEKNLFYQQLHNLISNHININEPQLSDDRMFGQSALNIYTLMFKRCNHFVNIPWRVMDGFTSSRERINYLNELKCRMCEEDFREMEIKLGREYELFVKYGGKL